ncbi:glycosyltransferase family 87 protein [Teichococcus aestuarii]|uniref:DUF2029 domain-containing protein n=1 Tax=Teichococcus aestuarii TaxID=568898 RepID=A0A2U1V3A1_9PROT|nr:glycosyltransferase family 87 protein [Pseudoroseomonas aestuarii]PWC28390.1 hypothetical protein CR165_11860 [Pseudoroseomonas aestuarii]
MAASLSPPARRALAAALCLLLLPLIVWSLARALPTPGLLDYGSFIASGRAASEGLDPYGIYPLTFHVALPGFESWNPNLNPPAALPLFQLLGLLDPHQGFRLWWSISVLCYVATILLLVRRQGSGDGRWLAALWAFALAGFWDTLVLGQIYLPLVLSAAAAWLLLDRGRGLAAGVAIGLVVAVKPNFAVWPVLLFLSGYYRPAVSAGVTALLLSLLPVLLYGPEVYQQWFAVLAAEGNRAVFLTNASLAGLLQRGGLGAFAAPAGALVLGALALWAWRCRPSLAQASALGLVGALLASPLAWVHYTLFLLPVFLLRPLNWALSLAAALLLIPVPWVLAFMGSPAWVQATFGSIYGWAVLLCLVGAIAGMECRAGGGRRLRRQAASADLAQGSGAS